MTSGAAATGKKTAAASRAAGGSSQSEWKEVSRRSKKVVVSASAISRVIGRSGCNINAVREISGAHIEVEKQKGQQGDRQIIIKGSATATQNAQQLIQALASEPDKELSQIVIELGLSRPSSSSGDEFVPPVASTTPVRVAKAAAQPASNASPTSVSKSSSASTIVSKSQSGSTPMSAAAFANRSTTTTSRGASANVTQQPFTGNTWVATKTTTAGRATTTTTPASATAAKQPPRGPATSSATSSPSLPLKQAGAVAVNKPSTPDMKQPAFGSTARPPSTQQPFAPRSPKPSTPQSQTSGSASPQVQPAAGQQSEYTPFTNNLFPKVASVWSREQRPNFASVAASGISGSSQQQQANCGQPQQQHIQPTSSNLQVEAEHDATNLSKAPGYRGNFISPSLSSTPSSSASSFNMAQASGSGHRSAPCTPPLMPASARQPTPPEQAASPQPPVASGLQTIRGVDTFEQSNIFSSASFSPSSYSKNFNLAPGARSSNAGYDLRQPATSTTFSGQHPLSSVGQIHPPMSSVDSVAGPNTSLSTSVGSSLNPNAPDFSASARAAAAQQQHANGSTLLRPALGGMAHHQSQSATRPPIPFQEVLPNPQLQMQMRAAILAAGASLQMQTLQQQQARYNQQSLNSIAQAQAQAQAAAQAAALANNLGAPDFSPPSAETLRLLHTAISSFPAAATGAPLQQQQQQPPQPPAPQSNASSNLTSSQYMSYMGGMNMRSAEIAAKADAVDDRKPLRPIGTERAQKKMPDRAYPGGGLSSNDLWPLDVNTITPDADWLGQQFSSDPLSSLLQNNYSSNSNRFDHTSSVDQVLDQQFQVRAKLPD